MNSQNPLNSNPASAAPAPSALTPTQPSPPRPAPPEPPDHWRKGKIARLPSDLRDQLNRRLQDGAPSKPLAAWLNSLPKVRAVLKADFAGQPINEMNLSNWRHGGFRDWLQLQEQRDSVALFLEEAGDLFPAGSDLSADISSFLAAHFAITARALLQSAPDPETRWQRLRQLLPAAARLRSDDLSFRYVTLAEERFQIAQNKSLSGLRLLEYLSRVGPSPTQTDPPQSSPSNEPKAN